MIGCALIPRLALVSALGERREMMGRPVALAPEPDGPQVIGEASGTAEAFGVRAGMRLAEALSRCPSLILVPPDPVRAEAGWERALRRLEDVGAAVEPGRAGEAFFALGPLRGLYGEGRRALSAAQRAIGPPVRVGAGPTRLVAHTAASRARTRSPARIVAGEEARRTLSELPVAALRDALAWPTRPARTSGGWERLNMPETLERLGVQTLGELAALPAAAVADRFGEAGLRALRIARGAEESLRPRSPHEELVERIALSEAATGPQLERALALLLDRLLARRDRRGRTLRRLRIEAALAGGGGWRTEVALRSASADPERLRLALSPRLSSLPSPASTLVLRALELGPPAAESPTLSPSPADERRGRLAEAVRQVRAAAGRDAVLQVLEVDPGSRVPERRAILTPWSDAASPAPPSRAGDG